MLNAANSSTDLAGQVLSEAFGQSFYASPAAPGSGSGSTFGAMFGTFNAALLAVGIFWFAYNVFSATIQTAESGEFMGQRFSTIWFPIRFLVGICSLVPMFGGYCGAQVIMMYFAKMGIGMANLVVATALSTLGSFNTATAVINQNAQQTAQAMFNSNLCMLAVNMDNRAATDSNIDIDGAMSSPGTEVLLYRSIDGLAYNYSRPAITTIGGDGACGKVEVQLTSSPSNSNIIDMSSILTSAQTAHGAALATMNASMQNLAQTYLTATVTGTGSIDLTSQLNAAATAYEQSVTTALSSQATTISNTAMSGITSSITNKGWMALGSFYQTLAVIGDTVTSVAAGKAQITAPQGPSKFSYSDTYKLALNSQASVQAVSDKSAIAGDDKFWHEIFSVSGQKLVNSFASWSISDNGSVNPIIAFKDFGDGLVYVGGTTLTFYTAMGGTTKAAEDANPGVIVVGSIWGSVAGFARGLYEAISPFAFLVIVTLFTFGITMSVYVPMLPFIVWFGGIMAWFATVFEGIIAAPVGAFAHLEAEGEGMGQRTQHYYMFLFGVLLRPTLMVFGFFGASFAVKVLGRILLALFSPAMSNVQFNSATGPAMLLGFSFVFISLVLTLIHGCFNLVHIVPDQVISWVGGQIQGQIGKDTDQSSKGHFAAGVMNIKSGLKPKEQDDPRSIKKPELNTMDSVSGG
jgi:conjugal transfer/type IV secretion protein DotA/TraY